MKKSADQEAPSHDQIAELAYFLYEKRGHEPGHELEDWLEAESRLQMGLPTSEPDQLFASDTLASGQSGLDHAAGAKRPLTAREHPLARDRRGSASREEIRVQASEAFRQGNRR